MPAVLNIDCGSSRPTLQIDLVARTDVAIARYLPMTSTLRGSNVTVGQGDRDALGAGSAYPRGVRKLGRRGG